MKEYNGLEIPVGVSLTHDKGKPVVFAYVGGKGRLGMRAKRFNPRVCGGMERALKQAVRWRKQALREHTAATAALDEPQPKKPAAAATVSRPRKVVAAARKPAVAAAAKRPRKGGAARKPAVVATATRPRKVAAVRKPVAATRPRKVAAVRKPVVAAKATRPRKVATVRKPAAAAASRSRSKPTATRRSR